jgi:hypothetical protein
MKRLGIFVFLVLVLILLIVSQVHAKEAIEYKISFFFQVDEDFCIISIKDPLGESVHLEKLSFAPKIINGELFLPMQDFARMMGGKIYWDPESKKIQMCFQGDTINFDFWLGKDSDVALENESTLMLSLKFIIEQLVPDVGRVDELNIVLLIWPLAIN